jgi:hypothetical protein
MGNPSVASKLIVCKDSVTGLWVIVYDFIDFKPNPNFWVNLHRISNVYGGGLIQYSVYRANKLSEAEAISQLVDHYGGEARVFKCIESNL